MLARVFLFYTGYYQKEALPTLDGTLSKTDVAALLKDCIDHSGHKLMPDFRNLWPYSNPYTAPDYPLRCVESSQLVRRGRVQS